MKKLVGFKKVNEGLVFEKREVSLKGMQTDLGGSIESIGLAENVTIFINDESKLIGLIPHTMYYDDVLCGNILFTAHNEYGEVIDLSKKQIEIIKEYVLKNEIPEYLQNPYLKTIQRIFA